MIINGDMIITGTLNQSAVLIQEPTQIQDTKIELKTPDGGFEFLGNVREIETKRTADEYRSIAGETQYLPRPQTTYLEIDLFNTHRFSFNEIRELTFKFRNMIFKGLITSWNIEHSMHDYNMVLKLEMQLVEPIEHLERDITPIGPEPIPIVVVEEFAGYTAFDAALI